MTTYEIVSLGAWCRPAHNIRLFVRDNPRFLTGAYPFDWTITSFRALQALLEPAFEPERMLRESGLQVSFAGSGQCPETGLIFHHALLPRFFAEHGLTGAGREVVPEGAVAEAVEDARGRFLHTWERFLRLKDSASTTVFVRWRRGGHVDPQYPEAFEGEGDAALEDCVARFFGSGNFRILTCETEVVPGRGAPFEAPVARFERTGRVYSAKILERRGWNGDQSNSFKGDEVSWRAMFDRLDAALAAEGAATDAQIA